MTEPPIAAMEEDRAAYDRGPGDGARQRAFQWALAETLDRPLSHGERLKQASRTTRALIVILAMGIFIGLALLVGIRPDVMSSDWGVLTLSTFVGLSVAGAIAAMALRGLHKPTDARRAWGVAVVGLAAPIVAALSDVAWVSGPLTPGPPLLYCFGFGLLNASWFALFLGWMQRHRHEALWRGVLVCAAAGICAFIALTLHCPVRTNQHVVWGHAIAGTTLGVVWAARVMVR